MARKAEAPVSRMQLVAPCVSLFQGVALNGQILLCNMPCTREVRQVPIKPSRQVRTIPYLCALFVFYPRSLGVVRR